MHILFATNTVKNCLNLTSKVEKSNTVNRCGILLRIIMSSFIPSAIIGGGGGGMLAQRGQNYEHVYIIPITQISFSYVQISVSTQIL